MDPTRAAILGLILLGILLFLRVHIAIALGVVGFLGLWLVIGFDAAGKILQITPFTMIFNYNLIVLPLFLLLGEFAVESGLASTLYRVAYKLLDRVPGGLAVATTMGCAAFGCVSGSSLATSAMFTKLSLPEMLERGYAKPMAAASIAAAGGVAALIPPSGVMVVYAIFAEQSIGRSLLAGIFPGILAAIVIAGVTIFSVIRRPETAPSIETRASLKEKWQCLPQLWPLLALILVIWGGMFSGLVTVNEAAAMGALAGFILLVISKRRQFVKFAAKAGLNAARTTSMMFVIVVGAIIFSRFLVVTRVPIELATFIGELPVNRIVIFASFIGLYLVLGCFLEAIGMMAITLPVMLPILQALGFDPIWFGVIVVIMIEVGFITPPVGLSVYVVKGAAGDLVTLNEIFRGVLPYVLAYLIVVVILTAFPVIALWLPSISGI